MQILTDVAYHLPASTLAEITVVERVGGVGEVADAIPATLMDLEPMSNPITRDINDTTQVGGSESFNCLTQPAFSSCLQWVSMAVPVPSVQAVPF